MPLARDVQSNFTAGEFDPLLAAREDTTFYGNAAYRLENVIVQPQGGARVRGGKKLLGKARGKLTALAYDNADLTMPNGGTVATLNDGNTSTTTATTAAMGTTANYVVFQFDFGGVPSNPPVGLDVREIQLDTSATARLTLQTSLDGSTWTDVRTISISGTASNQRLLADPGSILDGVRYIRLCRATDDTDDLGSAHVELAEVDLWQEGNKGEIKFFEYRAARNRSYCLAFTESNCDIFDGDSPVYLASARADYASEDVQLLTSTASRDTIYFFHEDYPPWQIQRQASDERWDFEAVQFDTVTEYPWGDSTVSGARNEIQTLTTASTSSGDAFRFELAGEFTTDISVGASDAATAANIVTGLAGLPQVTSVSVIVIDTGVFSITFSGDPGVPFALLIPVRRTGSGTFSMARAQSGKEAVGDLWSSDHGYPACGVFYSGRLFLAGFRDLPDVIAASRAGNFFDFRQDGETLAASPALLSPDVDERIEIKTLHYGRHLQIFSDGVELYLPTDGLDATQPALEVTTRIGAEAGLPTYDVEGATLFVSVGGEAVHEYLFQEVEGSYLANPISLLASHLVNAPKDLALRKRRSAQDSDLYLIVNTGTDDAGSPVPMAAVTVLRAQQVTAFSRITSPNATVQAVAAMPEGTIFTASEREIDGETNVWIETWDNDHMLDHSVRVSNATYDDHQGDGATVDFLWTFTGATAENVQVYTRPAGSAVPWELQDPATFETNLSIGRIEFAEAPSAATEIRIVKRLTTLALDPGALHLDGVDLDLVVDDFPAGKVTPSGGVIEIPDGYDFRVEYGFNFNVEVALLPPRLVTEAGPTYGRKFRIPIAAPTMDRTAGMSVGFHGDANFTPRLVDPRLADLDNYDGTLEETLLTGTDRVAGLKGWRKDPKLSFTRDGPFPWNLLSAHYDVVWN